MTGRRVLWFVLLYVASVATAAAAVYGLRALVAALIGG